VQVIGYGVRIYCHFYTDQLPSYVIQSALIVVAPVFYAASIYMVLGRLIRTVGGEHFSMIKPTRMSKWFIWGDFITLNVQGNGAGLTANDKLKDAGTYIVISGLILQLILFGVFLAVAVNFHMRMSKDVAKKSNSSPAVPWRQGLWMLYACSALIMIRSIFRVVEYVMGVDGYLLSNEWPLYVFDAALMWLCQLIFVIWFPHQFKVRKYDANDDGHVLVETSHR
jgi:hypothetical protein